MSFPKQRLSNIETLRLLAAIGVIVVHYIFPHALNGMREADMSTSSFYIISLIESIFVPAVNVFIIISGYFLCSKSEINLMKPINLLVQLVVFREVLNLILVLLPHTNASVGTFIVNLIPSSYFVILYISLYIISPYINIVVQKLDLKSLRFFIFLIFIVYSVYPFLWDVYNQFSPIKINAVSTIGHWGNQCGHTITHFVLMYCIGAYVKMGGAKFLKIQLVTKLWIATTLVLSLLVYHDFSNGVQIADSAFLSYTNPLIISQALFLLLIFKSFNFQNRKINIIAKLGFITYIICGKVYPILNVKYYTQQSFSVLLLHLVLTVVVTFAISYVLFFIYNLTINKLLLKYTNRKINYYSSSLLTNKD